MSYTTFSTLALETVRLAEDGRYAGALANSVGSMVFGCLAVTGGLLIGRAL